MFSKNKILVFLIISVTFTTQEELEQKCNCGKYITRNNRIYNGDIAPMYRYPWHIFLEFLKKYGHFDQITKSLSLLSAIFIFETVPNLKKPGKFEIFHLVITA